MMGVPPDTRLLICSSVSSMFLCFNFIKFLVDCDSYKSKRFKEKLFVPFGLDFFCRVAECERKIVVVTIM